MKLSYFLCRKPYRLTNALPLYILFFKICKLKSIENNKQKRQLNNMCCLQTNNMWAFKLQANQSVWTTRRFRFFSDFHFVYFRGCFISFPFQYMKMSLNTITTLKWTLCLCFSPWKKHNAYIWLSLDCMEIQNDFTLLLSVWIISASIILFLLTRLWKVLEGIKTTFEILIWYYDEH